MLRDTGVVLRWFAANAHRYRLRPDDDALRVWIVAAAERAAEVGDNPGGLFIHLVRDIATRRFEKLDGDFYDRAKRRLQNFRDREIRAGGFGPMLASLFVTSDDVLT